MFTLGAIGFLNPWLLAAVDSQLFGEADPCHTREEAVELLLPYVERELAAGTRLNAITRHVLGLYQQVPGARRYRRLLSEQAPGVEAVYGGHGFRRVPTRRIEGWTTLALTRR